MLISGLYSQLGYWLGRESSWGLGPSRTLSLCVAPNWTALTTSSGTLGVTMNLPGETRCQGVLSLFRWWS